MIARYAGGRALEPGATLEEMGLSSLERIEMMVALEEALNTTIDETAFSNVKTIADLERLTAAPAATEPAPEPVEFPSWNRALPVPRASRDQLSRRSCFRSPACSRGSRSTGLQNLHNVKGPVIFAANHQSHMDVPVILAALPGQMAPPRRHGDGEGIFQGAFLPRGVHARKAVRQEPQVLPLGRILQHVSAAAARGRRAPDAALCGRADQQRLLGADLSRKASGPTMAKSRRFGRASG